MEGSTFFIGKKDYNDIGILAQVDRRFAWTITRTTIRR
jgi:hypothetical protein